MVISKKSQPCVAVDLSSTHIAGVRIDKAGKPEACFVRSITSGVIIPALTGNNIADRKAVLATLTDVMPALAQDFRDVVMVIPDACCRLVLIDLDIIPDRDEEADTLISLKLKKSVPFDIEKAHVSWQRQMVDGKPKVLALVILRSVLEEYESVLWEAGYVPGIVLPSIVALLRRVDAAIPTLLINVGQETTSVAIVDKTAVILARILDRVPAQQLDAEQLADEVNPTLTFVQDKYGITVQRLVLSGVGSIETIAPLLEKLTRVPPEQPLASMAGEPQDKIQDARLSAALCAVA